MPWSFDGSTPTFDSGLSTFDGFSPASISSQGAYMSQYTFGAGVLIGTPKSDATGAAISNPSPVQFGALQDVSLDISFDTKMLYGSNQFPLAIGRGKGKISGKASFAQINGSLWNSLLFGQTLTAGIVSDFYDTYGTAIPATPFQITPVTTYSARLPGSSTWSVDLGVRDANGVPLTRVASAPATGQYSVSAGVYTFAAADTGNTVFISFQYTATSAAAQKSTVQNVLMGYAPTFQADLYIPYNGKNFIVSLPNCISTKLSIATKLDDFNIPSFDFEAFADASGNVLTYGMSDK